jgi:hypothetical protein
MSLDDLLTLRADLRRAIAKLTTTGDGRGNSPDLTEVIRKLKEAVFWISAHLDR